MWSSFRFVEFGTTLHHAQLVRRQLLPLMHLHVDCKSCVEYSLLETAPMHRIQSISSDNGHLFPVFRYQKHDDVIHKILFFFSALHYYVGRV